MGLTRKSPTPNPPKQYEGGTLFPSYAEVARKYETQVRARAGTYTHVYAHLSHGAA